MLRAVFLTPLKKYNLFLWSSVHPTFPTGRFCAREILYAINVVEVVVHLTNKLKKDNFATNSHVQIIWHECKLSMTNKNKDNIFFLLNLVIFALLQCMERVQIGGQIHQKQKYRVGHKIKIKCTTESKAKTTCLSLKTLPKHPPSQNTRW